MSVFITYFIILHVFSIKLQKQEVEIRSLSLKDMKDIHDLYPAGDIESIEVFQKLVVKLPGCGIFSLETGELLAWMAQSYYGAMFSMQTKPTHRRKGYLLMIFHPSFNLSHTICKLCKLN